MDLVEALLLKTAGAEASERPPVELGALRIQEMERRARLRKASIEDANDDCERKTQPEPNYPPGP